MTHTPEQDRDRQPSLLDAMADQPVPFVLTARARRAVAPESLPSLAVLAGGEQAGIDEVLVGDALADAAEGLDDPIDLVPVHPELPTDVPTADDVDDTAEEDLADPRRARARALRRAGSRVGVIATELGVDTSDVDRWTADVAPAAEAVRRERVTQRREAAELPSAFVSGRAAARASWHRGTAVSSGAAMVAGLAEVTPFALRLRGEVGLVAGVLQWLRDAVVVSPTVVSAQVAAAPGNALDRVAHDVAERLQVEVDRISPRPWADAPDRDAVEVVVRIADPHLAGTVAGWREALLASLVEDAPEVAAVS